MCLLSYLLGNSVLLTVLTAFTGKYYAIYWEMLYYFQGNTVFTELSTGKYCFNWEILCLLGNTV